MSAPDGGPSSGEARRASRLRRRASLACVAVPLMGALMGALTTAGVLGAGAQAPAPGETWVASWAASPHGPYPSGNPSAQPDLRAIFRGSIAGDQTLRLMIKPDLWGRSMRIHFTNVFGTAPVTFDGVYVGVQGSGGTLVAGTNRPVSFEGGRTVTIAAGESRYSDAVALPFLADPGAPLWTGRRLAISFHVVGESGRMTWHAKALTTSYVSPPGSGRHGADESDDAFSGTTTSWYFVDAIDVAAPAATPVIVCFGDSITDGTASTLNGDDRWPDVFARRMHARYGRRVSVVNAGIGGNRITGPAGYTAASPSSGGPSALGRLDRDVLALSGVTAVVWLEGTNDIAAGVSAADVIAGLRAGVARMHARGVRVIGATITSTLGNAGPHGTPAADAVRREVNTFIRDSGVFDGVADFDAATIDRETGGLRAAFQPNSTTGGAGDKLHPNRAGYQAMGASIDLALFAPLVGAARD